MECKICDEKVDRLQIKKHLENHNMSLNDYYEKFIEVIEPLPKCIFCDNKVIVKSLSSNKKWGSLGITCSDKKCIYKNQLEKRKKTYFDKYGGHPLQNEEIKNKIKQTCLDRYGVEYVFQNSDIKEKITKTCLKKYGVKNSSQNEQIKRKREETMINKYGAKYPMQNEEIKKNIHNKKNKFYFNEFTKKLENLEDYEIISDEKFYLKKFNIKIKHKCNYEFNFYPQNGRLPRCEKCFPIEKNSSIMEKEIKEWLLKYIPEKNIVINHKFQINNIKKEIDILIPKYSLGLEINGAYYHSEIAGKKNRSYHLNKTKFFKNFNFQIFHIWDFEWFNKEHIVKSMILYKLNKITTKISARKCEIKEISSKEGNNFLEQNHLQGGHKSKIYIGLFYNSELIAVMSFKKHKKYSFELTRFAVKTFVIVNGGFSKLLKYFENNYNYKTIITYADLRYSLGNIYYNNNFKLKNQSAPNYIYTNNYKKFYSRIQFQKHKLKNKIKYYDANLSEWENMKLNDYDRLFDCGNLVFVKTKS